MCHLSFFCISIQKNLSVMSFSVIQFSKIISEVTFVPSKLNRNSNSGAFLLRKEVIHPHVPVGIPCYDFTLIISPTFDGSLPFQG